MRAAPAPPAPASLASPPRRAPTSREKGSPVSPKDPAGPPGFSWLLWLSRRELAWTSGAPFPVSVCVQQCCTGPDALLSAKGFLSILSRRARPQNVWLCVCSTAPPAPFSPRPRLWSPGTTQGAGVWPRPISCSPTTSECVPSLVCNIDPGTAGGEGWGGWGGVLYKYRYNFIFGGKMVLFNGGGEWKDQGPRTPPAQAGSGAHPSMNWIWPSFRPLKKTFAIDLGLRRTQLPDTVSPADQPPANPSPATGGRRGLHCRAVFAISELCACPTSENCSVQETDVVLFKG